jgi:hypothetical protein
MRDAARKHFPRPGGGVGTHKALTGAILGLGTCVLGAQADDSPKRVATAQPPPAPLGVFGADMPAEGKFVFSICPLFVNSSGMRIGAQGVSSEYIVATTPWYFDPTKKLRLAPQNIAAASQTAVLAYGATKDFAIFVTAGMVEKNLEALTFKGASGVTRLGRSYTGTDALADFTAAGVYRLYQDEVHRFQINLGMSFPTGSNHNTFTLLQPDGSYASVRAFYGMQLGSGTYDILPGVVYAGHYDKFSWGLSYRGRLPLGANPQGYRYGDLHEFNGWAGYSWVSGFTNTFRIAGSTQGPIRGFDPLINGKSPPANPNFYGGQRIEIFGGAAISGRFLGYEALSIAVEAGLPIYQNLDGPQISKNWQAGMALRIKM